MTENSNDQSNAPRIERKCECGNYLITNDQYLLDAWYEWHEEGSFVAGSFHRPVL